MIEERKSSSRPQYQTSINGNVYQIRQQFDITGKVCVSLTPNTLSENEINNLAVMNGIDELHDTCKKTKFAEIGIQTSSASESRLPTTATDVTTPSKRNENVVAEYENDYLQHPQVFDNSSAEQQICSEDCSNLSSIQPETVLNDKQTDSETAVNNVSNVMSGNEPALNDKGTKISNTVYSTITSTMDSSETAPDKTDNSSQLESNTENNNAAVHKEDSENTISNETSKLNETIDDNSHDQSIIEKTDAVENLDNAENITKDQSTSDVSDANKPAVSEEQQHFSSTKEPVAGDKDRYWKVPSITIDTPEFHDQISNLVQTILDEVATHFVTSENDHFTGIEEKVPNEEELPVVVSDANPTHENAPYAGRCITTGKRVLKIKIDDDDEEGSKNKPEEIAEGDKQCKDETNKTVGEKAEAELGDEKRELETGEHALELAFINSEELVAQAISIAVIHQAQANQRPDSLSESEVNNNQQLSNTEKLETDHFDEMLYTDSHISSANSEKDQKSANELRDSLESQAVSSRNDIVSNGINNTDESEDKKDDLNMHEDNLITDNSKTELPDRNNGTNRSDADLVTTDTLHSHSLSPSPEQSDVTGDESGSNCNSKIQKEVESVKTDGVLCNNKSCKHDDNASIESSKNDLGSPPPDSSSDAPINQETEHHNAVAEGQEGDALNSLANETSPTNTKMALPEFNSKQFSDAYSDAPSSGVSISAPEANFSSSPNADSNKPESQNCKNDHVKMDSATDNKDASSTDNRSNDKFNPTIDGGAQKRATFIIDNSPSEPVQFAFNLDSEAEPPRSFHIREPSFDIEKVAPLPPLSLEPEQTDVIWKWQKLKSPAQNDCEKKNLLKISHLKVPPTDDGKNKSVEIKTTTSNERLKTTPEEAKEESEKKSVEKPKSEEEVSDANESVSKSKPKLEDKLQEISTSSCNHSVLTTIVPEKLSVVNREETSRNGEDLSRWMSIFRLRRHQCTTSVQQQDSLLSLTTEASEVEDESDAEGRTESLNYWARRIFLAKMIALLIPLSILLWLLHPFIIHRLSFLRAFILLMFF
uniref:Pecanex-like protein n=1 Tax=Syphacia muris TaxID=451379 RepID=A0A0N5AKC9_9BILA